MNEKIEQVLQEMEQVIFGKRKQCLLTLATLLSGGNLLLEDVPGVGKTTLALTLAKTLDLSFGRIQCTPDTLPGDITGYSTVNMHTGELVFHEGPVMNHILLADEINRTTENPIEFSGTYQLPEAQLDRFLMRISMGYPEKEEEQAMMAQSLAGDPKARVQQVLSREEVLAMQEEVRNIPVSEAIRSYILNIVRNTRESRSLTLGASPRATLALMAAAQAWAYLEGHDYVLPEDVLAVAEPVLAHRLVLSLDASLQNATAQGVLTECIRTAPVPPVLK